MKLLMSNRKLESENEKLRANREKYKFKEFDGITLITLVITIIILIILAGVGIHLSIGENGLFTKAKKARENYIIATNEEVSMIGNLEKQIGNSNTSGDKNTSETIITDSGEYFFTSYNGYRNTLGEGKINSLYGLTATKYETIPENDWKQCKYEKNLENSFDLSNKFELSFKSRIVTNSSNQLGRLTLLFEKFNNEKNIYESIININISDDWAGDSLIYNSVVYKDKVLYEKTESFNNKYCTIGIVGDGTNVKFYNDDTLLATESQLDNLSFDKVTIIFSQYQQYPTPNKMYLENLYFGNIKYYKDII